MSCFAEMFCRIVSPNVVFEKRTIRQNNSTEQLTSKCFVEMLQNPTWYSHNSTKHFVCNILGDTSRPKVEMFCRNVLFDKTFEGSSCAEKAKHFDKTFRFRNVCRVVRIPRWVLQHLTKHFGVFDVELFDVELCCRVVRIPRSASARPSLDLQPTGNGSYMRAHCLVSSALFSASCIKEWHTLPQAVTSYCQLSQMAKLLIKC